MATEVQPRYGIDGYLEWVAAEGVPVGTGLAIDLFALETKDWPRFGIRGGVAHCDARGDYCSVLVYDIPAGKASTPGRHLFEEVIYVLEGRGSTQLELADGTRRSFEWGPRSLFSIPLNAKHRQQFGALMRSNALRLIAFRDVEPRPAIVSDILEHTTSCDICDVRCRDASLNTALAHLITPLSKSHKLLWICIRQRTKQHCCNEAENGRVSSDAERQGQDRHCGETWTPGPKAQAVTNVLEHNSAVPQS